MKRKRKLTHRPSKPRASRGSSKRRKSAKRRVASKRRRIIKRKPSRVASAKGPKKRKVIRRRPIRKPLRRKARKKTRKAQARRARRARKRRGLLEGRKKFTPGRKWRSNFRRFTEEPSKRKGPQYAIIEIDGFNVSPKLGQSVGTLTIPVALGVTSRKGITDEWGTDEELLQYIADVKNNEAFLDAKVLGIVTLQAAEKRKGKRFAKANAAKTNRRHRKGSVR